MLLCFADHAIVTLVLSQPDKASVCLAAKLPLHVSACYWTVPCPSMCLRIALALLTLRPSLHRKWLATFGLWQLFTESSLNRFEINWFSQKKDVHFASVFLCLCMLLLEISPQCLNLYLNALKMETVICTEIELKQSCSSTANTSWVSTVPVDLNGMTVQQPSSTKSHSSATGTTENFITAQANQISLLLSREVLDLRQHDTRCMTSCYELVDFVTPVLLHCRKLQLTNYYMGWDVVSLGVADQTLRGLMS